ncbi:hypothetical protein [Flavobacterium faecale]|uniref:hypothetical protein n=1 Tax=Flavobacterium faecale TaxID=1355330 RepID=UPI003AAB023E
MKIKILKYVSILTLLLGLTACDNLPLQDQYDFNPEVDTTDPFANMTAWEYIQTRNPALLSTGKYINDDFNYLVEAIKKADMVEEFNQVTTKDRTYLLLNNTAFTGSGNVIQIVTGSSSVPTGETAEQTMAKVNTPEKLEKLKKVLRYHIVTTYIAQVPTLYNYDVWYLFQTLIPGVDGLIAFSRDVRWTITINRDPAPLPATALAEWETVYNHNYVFKNGIGHMLRDPVRNKPY